MDMIDTDDLAGTGQEHSSGSMVFVIGEREEPHTCVFLSQQQHGKAPRLRSLAIFLVSRVFSCSS